MVPVLPYVFQKSFQVRAKIHTLGIAENIGRTAFLPPCSNAQTIVRSFGFLFRWGCCTGLSECSTAANEQYRESHNRLFVSTEV